MISSIAKLKKKYHTAQAILVADRGLNSSSNLEMLQSEGLGFLMAQKVSNFDHELLQQMLDLEQYTLIDQKDPDFGKYRVIHNVPKFNPVSGNTINCTLILTYSETRRARDEAVLNQQVSKVQGMADRGEKLGPSHNSWTELALTKNHQKKSTITGVDANVEAKRRQRCGFSAMVFKEAPRDPEDKSEIKEKTSEDLARIYHSLNGIEECFRIMKHNLGLRPMYVWQSEHVRGHITVCVLALLLIKLLQRRLKDERNLEISIDSLCQALNEANVTMIRTGADRTYFIPQFSKVDHIRRGKEQYSTEALLKLLQPQKKESVIDACMRLVGLTPIPGMVDRTTLATCLRTRYPSDEDAVSELLLRECDAKVVLHNDEK